MTQKTTNLEQAKTIVAAALKRVDELKAKGWTREDFAEMLVAMTGDADMAALDKLEAEITQRRAAAIAQQPK